MPDLMVIDKETAPSRAKQVVKNRDILVGGTRPLQRRVCMIDVEHDGCVASTGYNIVRVEDPRVYDRLIYHILNANDFYDYIKPMSEDKAGYPSITDGEMKTYSISIPTDLALQKKVADILDRFDTLTTDISDGLPAEIKMRHQQYEYYRDKLLTFKRLEDKAV